MAQVSQIPWFDYLWYKNPYIDRLRTPQTSPILRFALARAKEREDGADDTELNNRDLLSRFLEAKSKAKDVPEG